MIVLFISEGCNLCQKILNEIPDNWTSHLEILHIKFDEERKYFRAYRQDEPIGDMAPVENVPALYFVETNELYNGYTDITNRLKNVIK